MCVCVLRAERHCRGQFVVSQLPSDIGTTSTDVRFVHNDDLLTRSLPAVPHPTEPRGLQAVSSLAGCNKTAQKCDLSAAVIVCVNDVVIAVHCADSVYARWHQNHPCSACSRRVIQNIVARRVIITLMPGIDCCFAEPRGWSSVILT